MTSALLAAAKSSGSFPSSSPSSPCQPATNTFRRLFLKDAGIDFKDIRYKFDDTWPATSADLKSKGISLTGKVPVLEYKGQLLAQHIPTLRYLSRDLGGEYDGTTNEEKYAVDAVSDLYVDWRAAWVKQLGEKTAEYKDKTAPTYYALIDALYGKTTGPFLLGDKVSYADFAVYQSIDNDTKIGTLPATLPAGVAKFKEAFEARPKVAAYLKERS